MLIELGRQTRRELLKICCVLSDEELIGQLCEECGELTQAAQKVRRASAGTTKVTLDDALVKLCEECADVVNCISTMIEAGLVDETGMHFISRYKIDRWYGEVEERRKA